MVSAEETSILLVTVASSVVTMSLVEAELTTSDTVSVTTPCVVTITVDSSLEACVLLPTVV